MWTKLLTDPGLLGQTTFFESVQWWLRPLLIVVAVIATIVICHMVGTSIARRARLPQRAWRVTTVLLSLVGGAAILIFGWDNLNYGVDLKGGVILVYQVESALGGEEQDGEQSRVTNDLIEALKRRLNPDGLKEIQIRPFGPQQVEIVVPEVEGAAIAEIKRDISTAGELRFRIVADPTKHVAQIAAAQAQLEDPQLRMMSEVRRDGKVVARWVRVGRETERRPDGILPLKLDVSGDVIRDARTGELIENIPISARNTQSDPVAFERWLAEQGIESLEILMIEPTEQIQDVRGDQLAMVRSDFDHRTLDPSVSFTMTAEGAARMAALTTAHLPEDTGFHYRLGIVLDNELISAPQIQSTIMDRGQITGRFTQEEVDFLVSILRAGRLPAVLNKEPISENSIGPLLGLETIQKGSWSIAGSLVVVLIFVTYYYRWAGLIACSALLMNLMLTLALLILFRASLTLPGLAGLVLTVGMSVDANVLIYERMREELAKGATVSMAIRNGFSRATTAIVDSNVTTFITAVVLYVIGTDQIRGYAVTLAIGILMCMFTAVFCSHVVFEIGERLGWIRHLKMRNLIGATNIDFLKMGGVTTALSAVVIVVGLIATYMRGSNMLDIDFSGGTSVVMNLREPMDDAKVREKLDEVFGNLRLENNARAQYTLNRIDVADRERNTVWKIDSSIPKLDLLESVVKEAFPLTTYSVEIGPIRSETNVAPAAESNADAADTPGSEGGSEPPAAQPEEVESTEPQTEATESDAAETESAEPESSEPASAEPESSEPEAEETLEDDAPLGCQVEPEPDTESAEPADTAAPSDSAESPASDAQPVEEGAEDAATPVEDTGSAAPSGARTRTTSTADLTFEYAIDRDTLHDLIKNIGQSLEYGDFAITLVPGTEDLSGADTATLWTVTLGLNESQARTILEQVKQRIDEMPVWEQASEIGSKVAGDTQQKAIAAMLISLLGIIAYIWIRFQRVAYGLAAVAALVHDVLVTLAAVALSYYFAQALSFLLIEEFKINLTVIAAFLTIIGYSLNDTIVIFDRIREIRGKSPELTADMINLSINQTLSRTILTSLTTIMVVFILYVFGGQGIHDFAFSLLIGMFAGVYSTVFIATPILLWLVRRSEQSPAKA